MRFRVLAALVAASFVAIVSSACDPTCTVGTDCPGPDQCDDSINTCTSDNVAVNCGSNGPQRVERRTPCPSSQRCLRGPEATNASAFCADLPITACDHPNSITCTADQKGVATCVASAEGPVLASTACAPAGVCRSFDTTAYCQ